MNITVKLIASHGRLSEREPYFVADNENLTLLLDTEYQLADFIADLRNGAAKAKLRQTNKTIEVPTELLKAGQLDIVITQYANGKVAKKWAVEPITIIEQNEGFEAYSLINELSAKVKELEQKANCIPMLAETVQDLTNLCNTNAKAVQQLVAIIKE